MDRGPLQKTILLYLTWLAAISGALIVMLGDLLPVPLSFVRPETLFLCFLECQVFFVVFIWPLFLPALVREGAAAANLLMQVGVLLIFSFPLALLCSNVSDRSAGTLMAGQALIAALAVLVAGVYTLAGKRRWKVGPWYLLAAFALGAGLPFLGFLSHEVARSESGPGPDLSFLAAVSPFWGAARAGGGHALFQSVLCVAIAAGLFVAASLSPKEVDAVSPAS